MISQDQTIKLIWSTFLTDGPDCLKYYLNAGSWVLFKQQNLPKNSVLVSKMDGLYPPGQLFLHHTQEVLL